MARKKSMSTIINQVARATAAEAKRQQKARIAEAKRQERARIAETKRLERERISKQKKAVAEAKKLEKQKLANEKKRIAEAKRREKERLAQEKKRVAEANKAEKERLAQEKKRVAEANKAEKERLAQKKKKATEAEREHKILEKKQKAQYVEKNKVLADDRTIEAQKILESMDKIIDHALASECIIDFDSSKNLDKFQIPKPEKPQEPQEPLYQKIPSEPNPNDYTDFQIPKPEKPQEPQEPLYQKIPSEPNPNDYTDFQIPKPEKPQEPQEPPYQKIPSEPNPNDENYKPKFGIFDFSKKRESIKQQAYEKYEADKLTWEQEKQEIIESNQKLKSKYELELKANETVYLSKLENWENKKKEFLIDKKTNWEQEKQEIIESNQKLKSKYELELKANETVYLSKLENWENKKKEFLIDKKTNWEQEKQEIIESNQKLKSKYKSALKVNEDNYLKILNEWENKKENFYLEQEILNKEIEARKESYFKFDPEAIEHYSKTVLSNSEYHKNFSQDFELEYNPENKILIVEYQLPSLKDIPTLKEVKYVQTRDEFTEKHITKTQLNKLYDNILYHITLRTIHELYEAHKIDALDAIIFNGHVTSIDPATGQETNACVLSIQANKEEFDEINLAMVEPKACFKKLKGVGSSKLHSLTPIPPLVKLEREDSRFTDSYSVVDGIDEGYNLAAMDWEDFENLIREIFEQAYASTGGEVKITQASRDGGIDAVIFDPNPLRGGKTVVQAKRYTNTVGVSAVRDLYGTLINEGANKGILVTTSDYGPDAHKFASDKPLQLINGSELLYLLEQYGYKARIDLQEAKTALQKEKNNL